MLDERLVENINPIMRSGLVVMRARSKHIIIDTAGRTVVEFENIRQVSNYNEDIAMVSTQQGAIYYIDKMGKRLFPEVR